MNRPLRTLILLALLVGLGGCGIHQSIGHDAGAFVRDVDGEHFRPVPKHRWDSDDHALLYLYRPQSEWGDQELMAPSFYVDGHHYVNLRSGGYTWLEILPGTRELDMHRPFFGIEGLGSPFSHILDAELAMEAGEIYFLRYSEVSETNSLDPDLADDHPLSRGPARLVSQDTAMEELRQTRFMQSVLLATNHAGTSIVKDNRKADYQRRRKALREQRGEEIQRMKQQGHYEPAPWYWPWGGGPSRSLETDRKLRQLERERKQRLAGEEEDGHWWWPL
ncbi:DUF2846 domain-containing protein [Salicola sp. Rm-C-2C1-2]|uniref:DUF2846 domain-containing protein n=1 Tax=Salicola sp. Rm-C-2C1-2 TaxID=3141321 RepID=UPI0032E3BF8C